MNKIESSFTLIGIMDGSTVQGLLRVDGTPLVQRYNAGTEKFTPDFTALADNAKPTLVLILRDTSTGVLLSPVASTLVFKYNGVAITFDANGLSTNAGMEGVFQLLDNYSAVIGANTYNLPAIRVVKNLVPISGYDNDRISVSASVEMGGNTITVQELFKDVIIQESTGNTYDILIGDDKGGAILSDGDVINCSVEIYKDGNVVTDLSGYSFRWVKETGAGEVNMGNTSTQAITSDDIDSLLTLRCDVFDANGTIIASGYTQLADYSDPFYIRLDITGITGNCIRTGQTAVITPVTVNRSDGSVKAGLAYTWTFNDNAGADFVLTGKSGATFSAAAVNVTYEDMVRAKMGLNGYVSTSW